MKVYKLTVMIIDFDDNGLDCVKETIENANYPNDCINPKVMKIEEREIGEWYDDHPLNNRKTSELYFNKLFESEIDGEVVINEPF